MRTYKFSKLKDKPEHRLNALMRKELTKINKLNIIISNSKTFGVTLSIIITNDIEDKIKHCYTEFFKISDLWNFKYNKKYRGDLTSRCYKDNTSKLIIEKYNKKRNYENKRFYKNVARRRPNRGRIYSPSRWWCSLVCRG